MTNEEYIDEIIKYVNKEHTIMNDFIEKIIQKPYTKEYQILCNAIFCFITNINTSEIVPVNKDNKEKEKIETLERETIALANQQTIEEAEKFAKQEKATAIKTIEEAEKFAKQEKATAIKTIEDITTKVLNNSPQKRGELKINNMQENGLATTTAASPAPPASTTAANGLATTTASTTAANGLATTAAPELPPEQPTQVNSTQVNSTEQVKESERRKQQENISEKIKEIKEKSLETFIKNNVELLKDLESAKQTLEKANKIEENIRDIQELKQIQELKEKLKEEQTSKDQLRISVVKKLEGMKNTNLDNMVKNEEKNPTLESVFKGIPTEKLYLSYYIINNYK